MVKNVLFVAVLVYASWIDIKFQIVPTHIHIMLLIVGLIDINISSFKWMMIIFCTLLISAMISNMGGGDVKFGAMCGFVLGEFVLPAFIIGLSAFVIIVPVICKIQHKPIKGTSFPLVPFLSAGCCVLILLL